MNDSLARYPDLAPSAPGAVFDTDYSACALERLFGRAGDRSAPAGVGPYALMRVAEQAPLIHEGSSARCVYLVQAGCFKVVHNGADGYEQVLDFANRHDLLGCDGMAGGQYSRGAVALEESWVYALPIADMLDRCHRCPDFNVRWQSAVAAEIVRAGDMAWALSAVGAEKRTARFIILCARRMAERGQSPRRLLLRMSRRDIAGHLGLAHASVSRSFSLLANAGILRVDNREIEIIDNEALHRFASTTRGYPGAEVRHPVDTGALAASASLMAARAHDGAGDRPVQRSDLVCDRAARSARGWTAAAALVAG